MLGAGEYVELIVVIYSRYNGGVLYMVAFDRHVNEGSLSLIKAR
jgi:hypothetical protein